MVGLDIQVIRESVAGQSKRVASARALERRWRTKLMQICDTLRKLRGDRPQKQVARLADVPQGYVSQVESGHVRFDEASLMRILEVYAQFERDASGPLNSDEGTSS